MDFSRPFPFVAVSHTQETEGAAIVDAGTPVLLLYVLDTGRLSASYVPKSVFQLRASVLVARFPLAS